MFDRIPAHIDALRIETVIDVGAAHGTPALYRRFPDARLLLVDPLEEHEEALRIVLESRIGSYDLCALGRVSGEVVINVVPNSIERSSILERTPLTALNEQDAEGSGVRTVALRTLDEVVADHGVPGPFGVKIDTEGFELEVLLGAGKTLAASQWLAIEVSIGRRFEGSYEFVDLVNVLDDHGFRLDNIMKVARKGHQARYADMLFVRREDQQLSPDSI